MDAAIGQYVVDVNKDPYQAKGEGNHSFNYADCGGRTSNLCKDYDVWKQK